VAARMYFTIALGIAFTFVANPPTARSQQPSFQNLSKATPEPHLFAEGIVSTEDDEVGGVFSPNGTEFYFAKLNPTTTFPRIGILCVTHWGDGKWSTPETLPFSGKYLDFPPRLSPDGQTMYFGSSRPAPNSKAHIIRIWKSIRQGTGWSDPHPLPAPINTDDSWNYGPSITRDGTLYFTSDRGEQGHLQLYRSHFKEGAYQTLEKLGPQINSEFNEYDAFVNADETLLFFAAQGEGGPPFRHRADTLTGRGFQYARGDIYFSRRVHGEWTPARHLEHEVNTVADEGYPALTPDEKTLIFTSERSPLTLNLDHQLKMLELEKYLHSTLSGHGNIYTIPVQVFELGDAH
jgi:hypothetical protein